MDGPGLLTTTQPQGWFANLQASQVTIEAVSDRATNLGHGNYSISSDGAFEFRPNKGYSGYNTFTFQATVGRFISSPITVTLNIQSE